MVILVYSRKIKSKVFILRSESRTGYRVIKNCIIFTTVHIRIICKACNSNIMFKLKNQNQPNKKIFKNKLLINIITVHKCRTQFSVSAGVKKKINTNA